MRQEIITSVLAVAAVATPLICSSEPASQYTVGHYNRQLRGTPTPLSRMDLTPTKALVRPYGQMGTTPTADRLPTVVSYKPFARGPVGSVGLVRMTASHALDSSALGNASEGQPGVPSQTVGANLLYAFH